MSSAPTSRWVTARTVRPSSAPMITPLTASCVQSARDVGDAEDHDVGGNLRRVDLDPRHARETVREGAGVLVVDREPLDVVVERPQCAGGHDPRLAQRAPEHLLVAPRLLDQRVRAREHAAHGRAEALGEVDPGGVEALRPLRGRDPAGDDGVHQPRAVHVEAQSVGLRDLARTSRSCASGHTWPPARFVVCSTDTEPRARGGSGARGAHRGRERGRVEHPALALERAQHRAGDRRRAAGLGLDRMRDAVRGRPRRHPPGCGAGSR